MRYFSYQRFPDWLKTTIPTGERFTQTKAIVKQLKLNTVCEEAKCPNIGECWSGEHSTATIMV